MASMKAVRKEALRTLELRRDGKLNADGSRKPSRLQTIEAEMDAADAAARRAEKRQVSARAALRKITAEIDAAEKILEATADLADEDESADAVESDEDESADAVESDEDESADEIEFDDEDGNPEDDEDETPAGPARQNGRFVKREPVDA